MAHVSQFPVSHFQCIACWLCFFNQCLVFSSHVCKIWTYSRHIKAALCDQMTIACVSQDASRTEKCYITFAEILHFLIRVSNAICCFRRFMRVRSLTTITVLLCQIWCVLCPGRCSIVLVTFLPAYYKHFCRLTCANEVHCFGHQSCCCHNRFGRRVNERGLNRHRVTLMDVFPASFSKSGTLSDKWLLLSIVTLHSTL